METRLKPQWSGVFPAVTTQFREDLSLDLDAKDRERLNSGVQSVLVKETLRPADLVERIRRVADTRIAPNTGLVSAS